MKSGVAAAMLLLAATSLAGQESPTITPTVFRRFSDRVVKIQVVETGSGAKAELGSGFFIDDNGHLVTNYHVISEVVHSPDRYRAELVEGTTTTPGVEILAIDVVHDLAVLRAKVGAHPHFTLRAVAVHQGDRLYSLGHPHDLGLSIVEGVYNGLLEHTLYPKLHFTGALNPGMSGGPTITSQGDVVGINVSTAGNEVSFLVPVSRALALADTALKPGFRSSEKLLDDVAKQIRAYQDIYLKDLFTGDSKTVDLGHYHVPTEPAPFFRCWGDANRRKDQPYERSQHQCSTDDFLFIAGDQESGVVELSHTMVTSTSLNLWRFYALYSNTFRGFLGGFGDNATWSSDEHVTDWRCHERNVRNASTPLRAVICLRRYKKLGELYDAVLKVAVLGHGDTGLVSTLNLSGVSFDNISRLTGLYLDRITWR